MILGFSNVNINQQARVCQSVPTGVWVLSNTFFLPQIFIIWDLKENNLKIPYIKVHKSLNLS